MVNRDKIEYLRCATVAGFDGGGSVLKVNLNDKSLGHLVKYGARFDDFDYDDSSLVFIDMPTLSGPANTSTYSSLNVGTMNKVMRRCSMAVGKQNISESDFSIALGRRGVAKDYISFVWSPGSTTKSPR